MNSSYPITIVATGQGGMGHLLQFLEIEALERIALEDGPIVQVLQHRLIPGSDLGKLQPAGVERGIDTRAEIGGEDRERFGVKRFAGDGLLEAVELVIRIEPALFKGVPTGAIQRFAGVELGVVLVKADRRPVQDGLVEPGLDAL